MTVEQIRTALDHLEANYSIALDSEAFGLAQALWEKITSLRAQLAKKLIAEDPYTTLADIRQFEGW